MSEYRYIEVKPSGAALGAEVIAGDLRRLQDNTVWEEIYRAWCEHLVIWFSDQPLSHAELAQLTLRFGPDFGTEPYVSTLPGHPHIMAVKRSAREQVPPFGSAWHSDWSFQSVPPAATLLHAKIVPPVGGDTFYANQYRAYETLPQALKTQISTLYGVHSARGPYGLKGHYAADKDRRTMQIKVSESAEKIQIHPLVRVHPDTARKALYVNPVYTIAISGEIAESEGRDLLRTLCAHAVKDEFVYQHRWAENMLTVWDNRCTQHLASGGYDGYERLLHRTTAAGTRPVRG